LSENKLDPQNIPAAIIDLIPLVEKWGIGDDFEREDAIYNATDDDLQLLATCLDASNSNILFDWLCGEESKNKTSTREYIAFTNFSMAIDLAKVILKKRLKKRE
jgi:hypothetical protein